MEGRQANYWRALLPGLHVDGQEYGACSYGAELRPSAASALRLKLLRDGFFRVTRKLDATLCARLAAGIEVLSRNGWPPLFILVYDEAWNLAHACGELCRTITQQEDLQLNFDCYAWRVPPGGRGWQAHRDRPGMPGGVASSPTYLTAWIALSPARRGEGCIHALRRESDPGFGRTETAPAHVVEGATAAGDGLLGRHAVPCTVGDVVVWGGHTVHWGGHVSPQAPRCRVSLAFAFATPACTSEAERIALVHRWGRGGTSTPPEAHASDEEPRRKRRRRAEATAAPPSLGVGAAPRLDARLRLIALQLWFYEDVQPVPPRVADLLDSWFEDEEAGEAT